ncbi:hypothetical protein PML78_04705 [Enterococcus dispar]|uniref:hypothetical protein n=1 Tax=Enterococcus dispar TaxID=44009 RepID=UPI00232F1D4B|nr:hypothetical protein [Enterococcus dispar]WCG33995.1 hypothetical protein PML78_04705 [Enterococcus dispar]
MEQYPVDVPRTVESLQAEMYDLRSIYSKSENIQSSEERVELLKILMDYPSFFLQERGKLNEIIELNWTFQSILREKGYTYESVIEDLPLRDSDKEMLINFIPDLQMLIPMGGLFPSGTKGATDYFGFQTLPTKEPNRNTNYAWSKALNIFILSFSLKIAVPEAISFIETIYEKSVDIHLKYKELDLENKQLNQRIIELKKENEFRQHEHDQKDRELDQKDRELDLKEKELQQQEDSDVLGSVKLSDKE